ncbi:MAG: 4a-hydroxytetrahydrobiopterin dehydratase [Chloroflexota bacterium]|nr:4a-hydroxytetrahydrobiopterin dehydratase [Chloroflexota bacterium]MDE2885229.1 4a-hydroxytetrahydrobiopterin dehydratase [Chloroflexota bacterium]
MALADEQCVELNAQSTLATPEEAAAMRADLPEWSVANEDGIDQLVCAFRFRTFALALAFTNAVGEAAEEQGHHPRIVTEYGRVTVSWWTHFLGGLHRNDFIMAARTDALAQQNQG